MEDAVGGEGPVGIDPKGHQAGLRFGAHGAIGAEPADLGVEHFEFCRGDDGAMTLATA